MKIRYPAAGIMFLFFSLMVSGQEKDDSYIKGLNSITQSVLKAQLGFLASDWTEGRAAGEKGEYLAADYIASMLQLYGIKPGGDPYRPRVFSSTPGGSERTYFQNFTLLKTMPGNDQVFKIKTADGSTIKTITLTYNVDYVLRSLRQDIEIDAPVVFAGYGFKNEKLNFNDYANIEVKGKFILKIAGNPPFAREKLSLPELSASSSETESMLRSMGAVGVIEFNPDMTVVGVPQSPEFMNMSPAEGRPRSGRASAYFSIPGKTNPESLIRISTSVKAANEILRGTGIVIEDYIKSVGTGKPVRIPPLTGKYVYMKSEVLTTSVMVRNVVGIIEGNNPDQVIVLGAHYDHMGSGNGFIWNGADDNASGTVGVMTAAKAIMATGRKPDKTIIVALWTSEEEGLLGSQYYVENLTYPLKNLRLYLNYDMISRYISDDKPNGVIMVYNKSYSQFKNLTEANLKKYSINLTVDYQASDNPAGPSDESSFVEAGVPIIRLKTAHREEYHTPADEFTTIDWDIMEKIVKINFLNVWTLANSQNW